MIKRIICFFITLAPFLLVILCGGCADSQPGKIAFVSDREGEPSIYVMNTDGSNQIKIGSWFCLANTIRWSPDGRKIAFIDADGWLCLSDADGGNLSKLAEMPSYSISWSPDGRKIATGCLDYDIYSVDAGTGKTQNLTNTPDAIESLPSWSPDSKRIAFAVFAPPSFDISLMDADGGNQTKLTSEQGTCEELAWSPVGGKVSYTWYSEDEQGPEGICRDICLVNTGDSKRINLTDSPEYDDRDASWSPDGSKIAFSSRRQVVDQQIYVMEDDGRQLIKLTSGESSNYFPSWSPDGKKIAYTSSGPYPKGSDIYIIDANGSNIINLTDTPDIDDYLPVWSPE
jgi:Tol biopolymer transport system component